MFPYQYSIDITEFFRSVETFWLVWIISVTLFVTLTIRGFHYVRKISLSDIRIRLRGFFREESGAAYSLSFAMTFPFYMLIVALMLEATFMLVAKVGTIYAAFAAARTAIVWTTVEKPENRPSIGTSITNKSLQMAQQAAVQAMVPFASGMHPGENPSNEANAYLRAYKAYTEGNTKNSLSDKYIVNKYKYAEGTVLAFVTDEGVGELWKRDVTATVFYRAPFLLPYVGRLLGGEVETVDGVKVVCWTMRSKATLLNECPKNPTGSLGINYATAIY